LFSSEHRLLTPTLAVVRALLGDVQCMTMQTTLLVCIVILQSPCVHVQCKMIFQSL